MGRETLHNLIYKSSYGDMVPPSKVSELASLSVVYPEMIIGVTQLENSSHSSQGKM